MKISYVLPVFNSQSTINHCIKSLLNQENVPHEIIIINDKSDDNSGRIIDFHDNSLIRNFSNSERKGAAYCRNFGNSKATGDIIAVCDADIYEPTRGDAIINFFNEFPEKCVFYSALTCLSSRNPSEQWGQEAYEWDFNSKCPISHPTVAYKKEVSNEIKYCEDSKDTDFYEFFLLDAHKKGYLFGGCQNTLLNKIEGDTKRDREGAMKLKLEKYKEYGINIES
jgi:glycosyltransferase involved in cell wall biosynthesis